MTRLLVGLAIVAAVPGVISRGVSAQASSKPTLAVARFDDVAGTKDSNNEGGKLADALAAQLADSGCCRVLPLAWMPLPADGRVVSVDTLREGAAAAGVQYIVLGSVSESTRTTSGPRSIAYGHAPTRSFGPMGPSRLMRPMGPMGPAMVPLSRVVSTNVTVRLRVIDVASGEAVRTLQAERGATSRVSAPLGTAASLPRSAAGLALAGAAAMASRPKPASDSLVDLVVQEVAASLIRIAPQLSTDTRRPGL